MDGLTVRSGVDLQFVEINHPAHVQIGEYSTFGKRTELRVCLDSGCHDPRISIGSQVYIGNDCLIMAGKHVSIGDNVMFGPGCIVVDTDHGFQQRDVPISKQPGDSSTINIDDCVWLGARVTVLRGVQIGRGAIVGAGAVVTKSIPPFEIWAGIPCKKIGDRPRTMTNELEKDIEEICNEPTQR